MATPIISQNFAAKVGNVVAADFDDAFGDVVMKFDAGIDNSNIAADAGIDVGKLARQYNAYEICRTLLADSAGVAATWAGTPTMFFLNAAPRLVVKDFFTVDANELLWLCEIKVWAIDVTADGAAVPRVEVYKNGTIIPGATFDLANDDGSAADQPYYLRRASPTVNPYIPFADGDVIEYRLGRSAATQPQARGIYVKELWKRTHVR